LDGEDRWSEGFVRVWEVCEKFDGCKTGERNAEIGGDFRERDKDEGALRQARMRNFEGRLRRDEIAVEEDVEVEGARAIGDGARTIASKTALDGEKRIKKWVRSEAGFKGDHGIEEARLIGEADGLGGIERGTRGDTAQRANVLEGSGERCVGRAGEAGKVGAESDVSEGHALLRVAEPEETAPELASLDLVASIFGEMLMDTLNGAGLGARRNEDIALDLLKFVAATAGVGKQAAPSTGFTGAGGTKPEEHVNQLLALYSRCLKAVEGKGPDKEAAK